uniref:F-box domain-containing protein n=1 Tax=Aegilops tauschii TaxID=37682 RepID=M8CJ17_AEGTA
MDHRQTAGHARQAREDRLSKLGDSVLGHILCFLGTKEAARAAALSSRWRDIFASVHTVALEEPEKPVPDYDHNGGYYDPNPPPPFNLVVQKALCARSRRPFPAAAPVPLRALRVALESYAGGDASTVDQWVTGALMHAGPELQVHLRLRRVPVCLRPDPIHDAAGSDKDHAASSDEDVGETPVAPEAIDENDDVASSADESAPQYWQLPPAVYTVPGQLFSSTALRALCLGSCRLCPPATIRLAALRALHLTHVPDEEEHVQRLISACTLLADLTLEACATFTLAKYLHLSSVCMGSCFVELPAFPGLRYLQLNGRALHNDPGHVLVASTNTILEQAPNLERLTLFFEPPPPETHHEGRHQHYFRDRKRVELLDAHHLHYNLYDSLDNALRASVPIAPCLRSRKETVSPADHLDAEKVVQGAQVLEGELIMKTSSQPLKEIGADAVRMMSST